MAKLLIFGGTREGREAAHKFKELGEDVTVSVTSEYARQLLPKDMSCHVGALDAGQMPAFIRELYPDKVIDATHPFAVKAIQNIRAACAELNVPYERIERPVDRHAWQQDVWHVKDVFEAAQALSQTQGPALITTGSNAIGEFTRLTSPARVWARVLPTYAALDKCAAANVEPSHIIAMQGPFSAALNAALYDQLGIRVMVTKDSGQAGGVEEKVVPALERQIQIIMIDRPGEEKDAR